MENQLKNKVTIITGASSGIGEGAAILFAQRGASVALCGRNANNLKATKDKCTRESSNPSARFITISGDVTDKNVREKIINETIKTFGRLDCLIHCAGVASKIDKLPSLTPEAFDLVFDTNSRSVFFLTQLAIPHLEKSQGNMIVLSSIVSTVPNPSLLTYSLAKASMDHFVRQLAALYGPKGVRFNTVRPSFVTTNMLRDFSNDETGVDAINNMMEQKVAKHHPLGERVGTVEENAKVMAFLASDEAAYVTGVDFKMDGASSLKGLYI